MSENIETTITIKTVALRPAKDLIASLENTFKNTGATVELETTQFEIKSIEPVHITIVAEVVGSYLAGRYILEPIVKWLEQLAKDWAEDVKHRNIYQPLNITLKIEGLDLEIKTEPYLLSEDWIANYCQNVAEILAIFSQDENLQGTTKIRLVSTSLDDIKILTYSDKRQPDYFIDLKTKTVKKIFDSEQEDIYIFPDTKGKGIFGLTDEIEAEAWVRTQLLEAKLYDEILKKTGRR